MTAMSPSVSSQEDFTATAERHRHELQVHCYRMMGSLEDAEDLVQETFLRAWRKRESCEERASFRAWLYRIATNACLDALKRRPRKLSQTPPNVAAGAPPVRPFEVPWLQPFPDELLDRVPSSDAGPDAELVDKETIELAYMVAIQHLPPQTRAVLILRDVLTWPAKDVAELLEITPAAVNSALQRAHATMKEHLPERRVDWPAGTDAEAAERELLDAYVAATETQDVAAIKALIRDEVRFSMPPEKGSWVGRDTVVDSWVEGGFGDATGTRFGELRCTLTRTNRQPAVVNYVRKPDDDTFRLFAIDVLRVEDGAIAEITMFHGKALDPFELPATL